MHTDTQAWTPDQTAHWTRIIAHPLGGADGAQEFVKRLTREQHWTQAEADAAVLEYRRFAFLACVAGHEVTPSPRVDVVWHLHLLYTRDYWLTFCPQVLGTSLHHSPSRGANEAPRYRTQYTQTLASYARWFGPAPSVEWPVPGAAGRAPARTPRAYAGSRRAAAFAVGASLPALVWAATPTNPLDWTGPEFIVLYLGLMLATVVVSLILRAWLRRQADSPNRHVGALSPTEVAFLAGGPQRAVDTAVAELHARGVLAWDAAHSRLVRTDSRAELEPPLAVIAQALGAESIGLKSLMGAAKALAPVQTGLERRGLWLTREAARRIGATTAVPAIALLAFGAAKIYLGVARDKPVGVLVALCAITGVFALVMYFARVGRSALGDREVQRLRAMTPPPGGARRPEQLALAVALGGTAVLAGTAFAGYHNARVASGSSSDGSSSSSTDSSSSSSSDSGGDSGGSSCGGCGGGGGD